MPDAPVQDPPPATPPPVTPPPVRPAPAPSRQPRWDRTHGLQLGRHRLFRSPDDKILGGVAGGLADLTNIDPWIWRGIFLVLTLGGGLGIPLYLALWIIVPRRALGTWPGVATADVNRLDLEGWQLWAGGAAILLALLVLLPSSGDPSLGVAIVLLAVGAVLWTRGRDAGPAPHPAAPPQPAVDAAPDEGHPGAAPTAAATQAGGVTPQDATGPDLDARAEAWAVNFEDRVTEMTQPVVPAAPPARPPTGTPQTIVPQPAPVRRRRRERSILGRLVFAIALLFVGSAALADEFGWIDTSVGEVASWTVVLLGVGILVGTWVGRARWLTLVAIAVLPIAVVGQTFDGLDVTFDGPAVDQTTTPTELTMIPADGYRFGTGSFTLDLRELEQLPTAPLDVRLGAGEVTVLLPLGVRGEIDALAGVGQVSLGDDETLTAAVGWRASLQDLPYGAADAPRTLDLDVRVGAGQVDVVIADARTATEEREESGEVTP